jgi:hypothetical protein
MVFMCLVCACEVLADESWGPKIDFYQKDGHPKFGVQMAEGQVYMTFTVNGFDISQNKVANSLEL